MAIRDIHSMLGELERLLKAQKGLNPSGRDAINNLLMTLEYSVRASIITDAINKSEPEMQEIKGWITSEIGKMEDEKRTLEEENKGFIIGNGVVDPKMSALTVKLDELRRIQEGIEDPNKLAERMTREFINPEKRRILIDTMGEYLYSGNLVPRTFNGKVLAPKEKNDSSFKGYSLNVEALKELFEVVRDDSLVDQAQGIYEKEKSLDIDQAALDKIDKALVFLPYEKKISEYAKVQQEVDRLGLAVTNANNSISNYKGNAFSRFFSNMFGKLKEEREIKKENENLLGQKQNKAKELQEELKGVGIIVNPNDLYIVQRELEEMSLRFSGAFKDNDNTRTPEQIKETLGKIRTSIQTDYDTHTKDLTELKAKADPKISVLTPGEIKTVVDCSGRTKSKEDIELGAGYHKDPQFALLMFEVLTRENEVTPEMLLEVSNNKERTQESRNMVAKTMEEVVRQRLDDIKGKLKMKEKASDRDDR